MKQRILFFSLLVFLISTFTLAQGHGFGLGAQVGTPTGISCKAWLSRAGALQVTVGYPTLSQTQGTVLSADYLIHSHIFRSHEQLPIFYGLGGIIGISGTTAVGIRGIAGFAWWPHGSSLDIYLQAAPTIYVSPSSKFEFEFGTGIRFFF
jgi:hypothetical protein